MRIKGQGILVFRKILGTQIDDPIPFVYGRVTLSFIFPLLYQVNLQL